MAISKKKAQQIHASRRAKQRFGINFGKDEQGQIKNLIQNGKATFLWRQSGRVTHWLVKHSDKLIHAVYDKERKQIITVLVPSDEDLLMWNDAVAPKAKVEFTPKETPNWFNKLTAEEQKKLINTGDL